MTLVIARAHKTFLSKTWQVLWGLKSGKRSQVTDLQVEALGTWKFDVGKVGLGSPWCGGRAVMKAHDKLFGLQRRFKVTAIRRMGTRSRNHCIDSQERRMRVCYCLREREREPGLGITLS